VVARKVVEDCPFRRVWRNPSGGLSGGVEVLAVKRSGICIKLTFPLTTHDAASIPAISRAG
jgi:hypothetical protein